MTYSHPLLLQDGYKSLRFLIFRNFSHREIRGDMGPLDMGCSYVGSLGGKAIPKKLQFWIAMLRMISVGKNVLT